MPPRVLFTVLFVQVVIVHCLAILSNGHLRPTGGAVNICNSKECRCSGQTIKCNCGSMMHGEELAFEGKYQLHDIDLLRVENCRQVRVPGSAFKHLTSLHRVQLVNIARIVIEVNGFSWKVNESMVLETNLSLLDNIGRVSVSIENSSIPFIPSYAFQGRLESIMFDNVQVGTVSPFAFSSLYRTETIKFVDTNFVNLESQAFKKFSLETLKLSGGDYGSLPSRTMVDLEVTKSFVIDGVSFVQVYSSAFIVTGPREFRIENCRFTRVEGDAFRVVTDGPVHVKNNVFVSLKAGSLVGITVSKEKFLSAGPQRLLFHKNNVTDFEPGSLVFNTTRLAPELDRIVVDRPCSCESLKKWADELVVYPPYTPQREKQLADPSRKDSTVMWCRHNDKGKVSKRFTTFKDYNAVNCGVMTGTMHTILIVIIGCSIVLVAIAVVIVLCVCRRRRGRWINVPTSNKDEQSPKKAKAEENDGKIAMVVPDGRVYRETEFHVIVEQTEPIVPAQEHIYQNLKPTPLPRKIKLPVPQQRTEL